MNDKFILLKVAELERRLIEAQQRSDDAQRQASITLISWFKSLSVQFIVSKNIVEYPLTKSRYCQNYK